MPYDVIQMGYPTMFVSHEIKLLNTCRIITTLSLHRQDHTDAEHEFSLYQRLLIPVLVE
jgi:hypothetical protein